MGIIIRQGFKASISNYIGVMLGFLSLFILFPLFYDPRQLGMIRIFMELSTVLSAFSLMGTNYSINRFFPFFKTPDQNNHGFLFWAILFPFLGYLLLLLLLLCFGSAFFQFLNPAALQYKELFPVMMLLILVILYQTVTECISANYGRVAVPNFMREVVMRILVICSSLLYYYKFISFNQSIWFMVLSYLAALCGNIFFLSRLTKFNFIPDLKFIRENPLLKADMLKYTAFLFLSGTAVLVIPKIDFFLISSIKKDLANVAIYSIGFYLATFIEVPKRTILQIATPIISNHMKVGNIEAVESLNKKNGTNQLIVSCILFFLIWINIDAFYHIMPRGDFFVQGKWVVFFIGLSKIIDSVTSGNGAIIANSKFYPLSVITIIVAAICGITFNYLLISVYGIIGGAISTILVMFAINLCGLIIIKSKLNIHPFHKDQFKILILFLCFISLSFTGQWLPNIYADAMLKTLSLGTLFVICVYKLKISEDFNLLLKTKLPFMRTLHNN